MRIFSCVMRSASASPRRPGVGENVRIGGRGVKRGQRLLRPADQVLFSAGPETDPIEGRAKSAKGRNAIQLLLLDARRCIFPRVSLWAKFSPTGRSGCYVAIPI